METSTKNLACIPIDAFNKEYFIEYCRMHRSVHDESDLYEEDLERYNPNDWPGYMLINPQLEVVGAIAYRKLPHLEDRIKARLVIWHVKSGDKDDYAQLLESIKPGLADVDHLFGFFPESVSEVRKIVTELGFTLDRYVWVLIRDDLPIEVSELEPNWSLQSFKGYDDAVDWCKVRNSAFNHIKGSEAPLSEVAVMAQSEEVDLIPGGMLILRYGERPVGIIRLLKESEAGKDYTFIAPIAIHPYFQGKGLGRWLLRAGIQHGKLNGYPYGMLTVNAENEKAADLYLSEGFEKEVVMMGYLYQPK